MKPGNLYKIKKDWSSISQFAMDMWKDSGPILYLGEEQASRWDGTKIINHTVLVKGEKRIVDMYFMVRNFEPLTNP